MNQDLQIKSMTKKELKVVMEVSSSKLQNYLNREWLKSLEVLGYNKGQRILSPRIVRWVFTEWGLID